MIHRVSVNNSGTFHLAIGTDGSRRGLAFEGQLFNLTEDQEKDSVAYITFYATKGEELARPLFTRRIEVEDGGPTPFDLSPVSLTAMFDLEDGEGLALRVLSPIVIEANLEVAYACDLD